MISKFLLGVAGLIIVLSAFWGGMMVASFCHDLLTPNYDICYVIWAWISLIPFGWICSRAFASESMQHPVATYLGLLPLILLMHVLLSQLGPGNPWLLPCMLVAVYAYITLESKVRQIAHDR
jgi:hypothetical protein